MKRIFFVLSMMAAPSLAETETFDQIDAQPLRSLDSSLGRWSAELGQAEILRGKGRSGDRCLKLVGGADVTVELAFPVRMSKASELRLWAERWTRVEPFAFRVEAQIGKKWQILNEHDGIAIGGFDTEVVSRIPAGAEKVRMICSSKAGVMIDDIAHVIDGPMQLTKIEALSPVTPLMRRLDYNPVMGFTIGTGGNKNRLRLESVNFDLTGTLDSDQIVSLQLMAGNRQAGGALTQKLAEISKAENLSKFLLDYELATGEQHFWISAKLKDDASMDASVQIHLRSVSISGKVHQVGKKSALQRIGVAVRKMGDDGSKFFRIPGLARSNKGTLCAVYDIRYKHARDLPADIDVGLSRSVDGGRTWSPMQVIMDLGSDPKFGFDGVGDPAILCDRVTGRLWVVGLWSHGNRGWHGSGPGLEPEQTAQLMMVHSDDDGVTWSQPRNLTKDLKKPEWRMMFNGPGAGITMRDGTLVFAAQYRSADGGETQGKPFSTIIWSKDRGQTWHIGSGGKIDTTEAQVVEQEDGSLILNCRDNRGGARTVLVTKDLGATWTPHATDRKALREPVCMGSVLGWDQTKTHFFSNPDSTSSRKSMTIKRSDDEGMSWPLEKQLLYDERVGFGYSCLAPVDDRHLGVLYEGGGDLFFLRIPIEQISSK